MDFTGAAYGRLLTAAREAGYHIVPVREALIAPCVPPLVILRHDVEWNLKRTLAITDLERAHGVRSSLYFRVDTKVADLSMMRRLQAEGFEIGYHFNTLDRCRGDFAAATALFERELRELRAAGLRIDTAIPHGDPRRRRVGYRANSDIFAKDPELARRTRLPDIKACLSSRYPAHVYFTDLGIRWNGVSNAAIFLDGLRAARWPVIFLLTHPDYWSTSVLRAAALQIAARVMRGLRVNRTIAAMRSHR